MPPSSSNLKHANGKEKHSELSPKVLLDLGFNQSLFINLASTGIICVTSTEGEQFHDEAAQ